MRLRNQSPQNKRTGVAMPDILRGGYGKVAANRPPFADESVDPVVNHRISRWMRTAPARHTAIHRKDPVKPLAFALAGLGLAASLLATASAASNAAQSPRPASPTRLTLMRALAGLPAEGHHALMLVALGNDAASRQDDAIVLHSASARYALRHVAISALKIGSDGSWRVENLPGACDGQDTCAQDAFLGQAFSRTEVDALLDHAPRTGPVVTVFDLQGRVIGRADDFDNPMQVQRFAEALRTATPARPAVNWTLADTVRAEP